MLRTSLSQEIVNLFSYQTTKIYYEIFCFILIQINPNKYLQVKNRYLRPTQKYTVCTVKHNSLSFLFLSLFLLLFIFFSAFFTKPLDILWWLFLDSHAQPKCQQKFGYCKRQKSKKIIAKTDNLSTKSIE